MRALTDESPLMFVKAHQLFLEELDKSYQKLRRIHEDIGYLNTGTTEYKEALEEFNDNQASLFALKAIWSEARDLA